MTESRCADLRVEYQRAPRAIGTATPRFSWTVDHAQLAYELEVTDADGRSVWSTGSVGSAASSQISFAGEDLRSDADYRWRVRSIGVYGPTPWAESTFATALLSPAAWSARWVEPDQDDTLVERWSIVDWIRGTGPDTPPRTRLRPARLLRGTVTVGEGVVQARLHASARGVYTAWINGLRAGDEVLAPGFDSYLHRISTQTYDVALRAGENVLAFALADGWWAGRIGLTGSSAQFGTRTALIWQLHVTYADGRVEVIGSDGGMRSATGGWDYADPFVGERFDRRAEPEGWRMPGFDDARWSPVTPIDADRSVLVPFTGEPIRRVAELAPTSITETEEGIVVDFGQVIAGRVRLRLRGLSRGREITLEHTETLDAAGDWFQNIVGIDKDQTDVFVSAGGDDEWEPEFTFHGFRYARVSGLQASLDPSDIVAVVLSSDLEQTGTFTTSDPRLNRLHDNVVWSQRANLLSVPTDCPQRERAGWTGDAQVFAAAATNNALVAPFLSRWLDNLRADQLPDGRVPITSPRSPFDIAEAEHATGIGAIVSSAGWSDAIAFVPWTLYERYGDERVLADNYPAVLAWIDHQRSRARAELPPSLAGVPLSIERRAAQALLYNSGDHFGDWLTPSTIAGRPLHEAIGIAPALTSEYLAPMFQAQTLTLASRMAEVLGKGADAARLAAEAASVRAAFAAEYVDADGRLPVELQGPHAIALSFDMIPADRRAGTAGHLAALVRANGDRLDTGFLSVPYLLDALWDGGHRDLARRLLWQRESPSWLYAVDHSATTIWESWDAIGSDGSVRPVSLNHYAFGCVDDWLYRRVAGLQPTAPGWRRVRIEPDLDAGVESASAHVGTPAGRLAVDWRRSGDEVRVRVAVPSGVDAVLVLGDTTIALTPGATEHVVPVASPLLSVP
ncbi:family 78 glycoside hydrolase catalytic domain [Microbacterium sp. B2969]|uniref:alpha-L-rhamnosidase n=1 Tax=Microbacterium alkaliflavum TaxID=3248839 RepID=A0ABW7QAV8_9MICO